MTTPKGRLSYPHLMERNSSGDYPSDKYETLLLIPKSENINPLKAAAEEVLKQAFGAKYASLDTLKNPPLRDGDEKGGEYAGHWFLKAKTDNRPGIVGRNPKERIDNPEEIYGGQWAKLSLVAYSYNKAGNSGVAFSLQNVQILGNGEKFGGGAGNPETQFTEEGEPTSVNDNF